MQIARKSKVGAATFQLLMALDEAQMRERLSGALRRWREQRSLSTPRRFTQYEAVEELREALTAGVTIRTYTDWELGKRMPRRWGTIEELCDHINYSIEELTASNDDSQVTPSPHGDEQTPDDETSTSRQDLDELKEQISSLASADDLWRAEVLRRLDLQDEALRAIMARLGAQPSEETPTPRVGEPLTLRQLFEDFPEVRTGEPVNLPRLPDIEPEPGVPLSESAQAEQEEHPRDRARPRSADEPEPARDE